MTFRVRLARSVAWKRHTLTGLALARKHPLRYLFLEVTRRCNLACLYCGSSCTIREQDEELTTPQWIDVVRQVAADFRPRDVMVAVTGGEPLLKDGIWDLLGVLGRLGFRYGMVSNGALLDAGAARRLVDAGIGSISLSMDAPPDLNDRLRGPHAADGVIAAIGCLRAAGYGGKLEIITTVTKPVLPRLDEMRRFVASLRVPLWRVAPVMPIGRALRHPDLLPSDEDVRWLLEWVRASRRDAWLPRPELSEEGFIGDRFEGQVRPYLCQCRAGVTIAGVRRNGKIGACPELAECFDQGDVRTDRFKDVWDRGYRAFRDRSWTKDNATCAGCGKWSICRGGSLHLYQDTKSEPLRCLYAMCKGCEGKVVTVGMREGPAPRS